MSRTVSLPANYRPGDPLEFWGRGERPAKTACVVRYGAFGDHLMAASVLPLLKRQGFHVTYNTTERGMDILARNPHIDTFLVQESGQIENDRLSDHFASLSAEFDRFVNLCESIEGTLLAYEGRPNYWWSHSKRREQMGTVNYLERTHDLAGVPYVFGPTFHPSGVEKKWAQDTVSRLRGKKGRPVIVWALAGSSVHKTWPWLDNILAALMLRTTARVILVGDELCQMLEIGWEKEPRVIKRSGKWSIRQTLSIVQEADLVIGPETGVLHAVAFNPAVGKIVTLSHSSATNLTKHWRNVTALGPQGVSCFPCHRMHYGFAYCRRDAETGTALCQARITPEQMWGAIAKHLDFVKG